MHASSWERKESLTLYNGVGTNFGVGVGETRPEGPRAGDGVLGEGAARPSPPDRGFAGALPGVPAAEGFSCIMCRQIAFPSISVRVAYSLHGEVLDFSRGIYISISPT